MKFFNDEIYRNFYLKYEYFQKVTLFHISHLIKTNIFAKFNIYLHLLSF